MSEKKKRFVLKRASKSAETASSKSQESKSLFHPLMMAITVVNQGQGTAITKIMETSGAATSFVFHGEGTAVNHFYEIFTLENANKQVILTPMREDTWPIAKSGLETRFRVSKVAKGISFVIKISSIIGTNAYKFVANERPLVSETKGDNAMEETRNENYEVVFAIVNDGFTDLVMEAARGKGAKGGTIINARGTGNKEIEKFFGVSIAPEKQIVMILVPKDIKDAVLTAIYQAAGLNSKGQGIAFSVPATDVVGIVENVQKEEDTSSKQN
jgi:nitrogen regulatory protein PII